jgi:4-hydroxybenzoate polyprenyltransferase
VAILAGADATTAVRLGVAMTALQASIGALNDLLDVPRDRGLKPGKPIPAGLVSERLAWAVVVAGAALGLVLCAPSGLATVALAVLVLAIGYGYDLVFKGSAWSWFPFAIGIPLLPVFGWLGTTGGLPDVFAILLPVAVIAGAALAIANARADAERDAAAGVYSVAVRLGLERSWAVNAGLLAVVVGLAIATLVARSAPPLALLAALGAGLVIGLAVAVGRRADSVRRERAWELEAVGVGLLAAAWLAGTTLGQ